MTQFFGVNKIGIEAWSFEFRQNTHQIAVGWQQIVGQGRNPQSGLGCTEDAIDIVQLQDRAHVRFELLGCRHHPVDVGNRRAGIRTINNKAVILELFRGFGHAVLFDIFRRCKHMIAQGHQLALNKIGLTWRLHPDGNIGLTHGKVEFLVIKHQRQFDFRVAFKEFVDSRR